MKKKEFQNLPSTETPINAENLNEIQSNIEESCVIVSPTEPTTNEKVWIQKGKNLFDIDAITQNKYLGQPTGQLINTENSNTSDYIPVVGGKTYILSVKYDTLKLSTTREIIYFNNDKSYRTYQAYDSNNKTIIIEPNYDGYIRFDYDKNCYDIMVEQNSTATEYEAYIDKKIWCKNNNGMFEEFVNIESIKNLQKQTIYNGKLKGGENIVLSNVKRFLDIYFLISLEQHGSVCGKYTIDTQSNNLSSSSCVLSAIDATTGLDYYISESTFKKTNNTLTHNRTGYFSLSTNTFKERNGSEIYYIYKIETYD